MLFLNALTGDLVAQSKQKPRSGSVVFTNITVIDATGAPAKAEMTVVITGDRIAAIGETGKVPIPKAAQG